MSNTDKKSLSFVFTFRNEEDVLQEFIDRFLKAIKDINYAYEMIFVNDCSTDKSLEIIKKNRSNNKNIKIINMSRRFGVSACIIAGFKHCSGNAVIYMDCDLQDPPEVIPSMIKKWETGCDVVHTVRTKRLGENFFRLFLVKIAYKIIDGLSEIKILHNSGNFKLISKRALLDLLKIKDHDPFLRGLSAWVGYKQDKIFYERDARAGGKTHFSLLRSAGLYQDFLRGITTFSSLPLYFSLLVGFIISFGAFIYLIFILILEFFYGIDNSGWPSLMVTLLFLGGSILFAIGIQGIYVGKIHEAIKNRPRYLIESKSGFDRDTDRQED